MELCLAHPIRDSILFASNQDSLCPLVCLCFLSVSQNQYCCNSFFLPPDEVHLPANRQTNNSTSKQTNTQDHQQTAHTGEQREARVSVVETSALTLPYLGLPTSKLDWSLRSPAIFWYSWFLSPGRDRSPAWNHPWQTRGVLQVYNKLCAKVA